MVKVFYIRSEGEGAVVKATLVLLRSECVVVKVFCIRSERRVLW